MTTSPSPSSPEGIVRSPRSTPSSPFSATNARIWSGRSAIVVGDHQAGSQREQGQLPAPLGEAAGVESQGAGEVVELRGHGPGRDARRARDLLVARRGDPL